MNKRFKVTGACHPHLHYMADTSAKFARVLEMVEQGDYFAINRPRQYGKTTLLFALAETLKKRDDYVVFRISFEGVGDVPFANERSFCDMFLERMLLRVEHQEPALKQFLQEAQHNTLDLKSLSSTISALVQATRRKTVLLIDEVDKSSNNQLFVSFLGILRDKYLERTETPTFHAVILAGVHDVKTLKLKMRPDAGQKYNSPWNIAATSRWT